MEPQRRGTVSGGQDLLASDGRRSRFRRNVVPFEVSFALQNERRSPGTGKPVAEDEVRITPHHNPGAAAVLDGVSGDEVVVRSGLERNTFSPGLDDLIADEKIAFVQAGLGAPLPDNDTDIGLLNAVVGDDTIRGVIQLNVLAVHQRVSDCLPVLAEVVEDDSLGIGILDPAVHDAGMDRAVENDAAIVRVAHRASHDAKILHRRTGRPLFVAVGTGGEYATVIDMIQRHHGPVIPVHVDREIGEEQVGGFAPNDHAVETGITVAPAGAGYLSGSASRRAPSSWPATRAMM